jgi:hypothetical protein
MERRTQRRLTAALGVFLLAVSLGVAALLRGALLDAPLLVAQLATLAAAGALDVVAGTDTPLTDRVAWYRLSGLGNVFLAVSLPLGLIESVETLPLVLALLGSGSLAVIGVDMLIFDGRHAYTEPLAADADGSRGSPEADDAVPRDDDGRQDEQ